MPIFRRKHVEDNSVTNILLMNKENCALKLVDEIILLIPLYRNIKIKLVGFIYIECYNYRVL